MPRLCKFYKDSGSLDADQAISYWILIPTKRPVPEILILAKNPNP